MACLLYLNSRDAITNDSTNHDLLWTISQPRLNLTNGFLLTLESAEIPNGVYPFNSYNNVVKVQETGGANPSFSATITPSEYTGTSLATHLGSIMTTASAASGNTVTYTVSYDSATKKFTFSGTATFGFIAVDNDAYEELGFSDIPTATGTSLVSDFPINLSGSAYVDLISGISSHNHTSSAKVNILARIPLTASFGDVLSVSFPESNPIPINSPSLSEIRIQLRDDHGNPWKLPGTHHLSLTFRIEPILNKMGIPHGANSAAAEYASLGALARI